LKICGESTRIELKKA